MPLGLPAPQAGFQALVPFPGKQPSLSCPVLSHAIEMPRGGSCTLPAWYSSMGSGSWHAAPGSAPHGVRGLAEAALALAPFPGLNVTGIVLQVKLIRLVGIMLLLYVKADLAPNISEVEAETVGTGIMGRMVGGAE